MLRSPVASCKSTATYGGFALSMCAILITFHCLTTPSSSSTNSSRPSSTEAAAAPASLTSPTAYMRKPMTTPPAMTQSDADAVFAAGWDERALRDTIAITAREAFMQRLVAPPDEADEATSRA